jgi:hypothetical protein
MNEKREVREIANGIYTVWKVHRPSKLQRLLQAIDGKHRSSQNDRRILVETSNTEILITTYHSKVTIHKVSIKESRKSVSVSDTIDINNMKSKSNFINSFVESWQVAKKKI